MWAAFTIFDLVTLYPRRCAMRMQRKFALMLREMPNASRLNPHRLRAITIGKVSNKTNNHTKINWRDARRHMTMFYLECSSSSTQFAFFFSSLFVVEQWRPVSIIICAAVSHTISIFVHCWAISNSLEYVCCWFNGVVGLRTVLTRKSQSPDEKQEHWRRRRWRNDRIRIVMCDRLGGYGWTQCTPHNVNGWRTWISIIAYTPSLNIWH